jgi:hypothetical protein
LTVVRKPRFSLGALLVIVAVIALGLNQFRPLSAVEARPIALAAARREYRGLKMEGAELSLRRNIQQKCWDVKIVGGHDETPWDILMTVFDNGTVQGICWYPREARGRGMGPRWP